MSHLRGPGTRSSIGSVRLRQALHHRLRKMPRCPSAGGEISWEKSAAGAPGGNVEVAMEDGEADKEGGSFLWLKKGR